MMAKLRVGVIGAGFWARYQIAAWQQIGSVEVIAITNRTVDKAQRLAANLGIPIVARSPEELVGLDEIDVVDVITSELTHHEYTLLAAKAGKHVICQKPMAGSFADCKEMVAVCDHAGVRLFVHDNFRWQTAIRRLVELYRSRPLGRARRIRLCFLSSFPVYDMQPSLRVADRFILMDVGTHLVDTARAFIGDVAWVSAQIATVARDITGEDMATILAGTRDGTHCVIELSYASPTEGEHEFETLIQIECEDGVMELDHGFRVVQTNRDGKSTVERVPPAIYDWVTPRYAISMGSCLPANQSFHDAIANGAPSENDGRDYLNTMETIFAAYESAHERKEIRLETGGEE